MNSKNIKIAVTLLSILFLLLITIGLFINKQDEKIINLYLKIDKNFILSKDDTLKLYVSYRSIFVNYDNIVKSDKILLEDIKRLSEKYPRSKKIKEIKGMILQKSIYIDLIKRTNSVLTSSMYYIRHLQNELYKTDQNSIEIQNLSRNITDLSYHMKLADTQMINNYQELIEKFKKIKVENKRLLNYKKKFLSHTEIILKYSKLMHKDVARFIKLEKNLNTTYSNLMDKLAIKHQNLKKTSSYIQILILILLLIFVLLIAKLLKIEKLHKDREAELKNIIDKNIISSTTDIDGIITDVSQACCDISGYKREELIGFPHSKVRDPKTPSILFENLWKTIQAGKTWKGEMRNIRKNGTYFWVTSIIEPVFDNHGKIISYLSIKTNITSKKKLEELSSKQELIIQEQTKVANEQRDKALAASKAKSEFLANMSHEIRTPLNAILGFIKLLKEEETDQTKQNYLKIIESSSGSLLDIINDILDFSKIESGKLGIDKINFNPSLEFNILKKMFKTKLDEKNIIFIPTYKDLPSCLYGDISRIKQIVNNLLSNAIKFTPPDKHIYLDISYKNKLLCISIKDEGIGINQNYREKIFEAFSQEDTSTTRKYGGTGLGLAISYNLTKAMGGELKLKSKVSKGSEFYFSLPLEICQNIEKKQPGVKNRLLKGRILVAEDNKANQMFMKVLLKKMGLELNITNDGIEVVDEYKNGIYDVILMDENMPNMSGIEATKQILEYEKQNNLKHTPIIALTANALKGDRERFLRAGMDEYLTKPINRQKLTKILERFLEDA